MGNFWDFSTWGFFNIVAVLLVSLSVGATLAYLTSTTQTVKNTFTVGKVNITLDEVKVNENYSYFVQIKKIENTIDDGSDALRKF